MKCKLKSPIEVIDRRVLDTIIKYGPITTSAIATRLKVGVADIADSVEWWSAYRLIHVAEWVRSGKTLSRAWEAGSRKDADRPAFPTQEEKSPGRKINPGYSLTIA